MNRFKVLLLTFATAPLLLTGCALFDEDPTTDWSAAKLYEEAQTARNDNDVGKAKDYLTKIESRYPFTRLAQQAQVELAYIYFIDGDNANCILSCDRFLTQYPDHELSDYVLYLKAMAIANEPDGFFGKLFKQDIAERDGEACRASFDTLKELVTRFPESRYAPDARKRMHELVLAQAKNELNIARYYYVRRAYVAALQRAQIVIREYQQTPYVDDALKLMRDCYEHLGITDLQSDVEEIMKLNTPAPKS